MCTRCHATLGWEGDAPDSEEDAICHDCAWKELEVLRTEKRQRPTEARSHPNGHVPLRQCPGCGEYCGCPRTETAPTLLPNGWPQPSFLHLTEDGGLLIEWINDERRVSFYGAYDDEPCFACLTSDEQRQEEAEGDAAAKAVAKWLAPMPTGSGDPT